MNTHNKRENLLNAIRNLKQGQPVIISLKGATAILTSRKDKQELVDLLSEKNPTYVELFDFPNMTVEKSQRAVKSMLDECLALKPETVDMKISRLHLDAKELTEDQLSDLAAHIAKICAEHETPDVTCDTGDMQLNGVWNTVFYGLTSGNGMDDVFGSFMALGGELAAMRKFDAMRSAYDCALGVAETDKQKAEAHYVRGCSYHDFLILHPGSPKERLYNLAIQDLESAAKHWPDNNRIKADLGRLYIKRGVYYGNRSDSDLGHALSDFKKADALVEGRSPAIKELMQTCEKAIEEVKALKILQQVVEVVTRERMERGNRSIYGSSTMYRSGESKGGPSPDDEPGFKGPRRGDR